jgi:hypothetical protein
MKNFIQKHEWFLKTVMAILFIMVLGASVIQRCFNF